MTNYRKYFFMICLAGIGWLQIVAQSKPLVVERQGDHLIVTAPQLHFLLGKPLEQLHNGASVTYITNLVISAGGSQAFHLRERFIVSYDLWEEKFSVVQEGKTGRAASHLSAEAAETWCLGNLSVPVSALKPDKSFTLRLECTVDPSDGAESGPGLTLAGLIDALSRKQREELPHWEAASEPLRISNLKVRQ
jgi:hypothetical protein